MIRHGQTTKAAEATTAKAVVANTIEHGWGRP
jgi:hypothetical protein